MINVALSGFQLKTIAIVCMVIDHTGAVFFPQYVWMRIVGRLTFPIIAWMLTIGYTHTKNFSKYIFRLAIIWLISQIPYYALFKSPNIFLTLITGLCCIYIADKMKSKILAAFLIAGASAAAQILHFDYGAYGVFMILFFYILRNNFLLMSLSQVLLVCLYTIYLYASYPVASLSIFLQCFSLFALVLIYLYNGKQGVKAKYLFYVFYPVHLVILLILRIQ